MRSGGQLRILENIGRKLKPSHHTRRGLRRREPQETMVRAHARIQGLVQGVYYRAHAKQKAARLGVTGWIRNLADGTVEALIEGNEPAVRGMLEWCRRGSPRAVVERVDVTWEPYSGEFDRFSARETPD